MHPILLKIGPITIYSYGLMLAFGIILAALFAERHAAGAGIAKERIADLVFWVVICGLIGARVFYVLINLDSYLKEPLEIFKIYKGGLVFHGGFIFGFSAAWVFIKKNKLPFLKTLDIVSIYVPLAHGFGRIGCFLNGCCYGKPTSFFLKTVFPNLIMPVHPTQLYSAFLLFLIFGILFFLEKRKTFAGQVFFSYLMLSGLARFFIEFLRADTQIFIGYVTIFQIISFVLFLSGLFLYLFFKNTKKID